MEALLWSRHKDMTAAIYCPSNISNKEEEISQTEVKIPLKRKWDAVKIGQKIL